jgi:heat shock protein HtpX
VPADAASTVLAVPASITAWLAVAGFAVAILAALLTPVLARTDRLEAWAGPLRLVPYALLLAGALLAGAAAVLGSVTAVRPGVREVASGALFLLCVTPLVGASIVRLRYGAPGKRSFYQQIAANRGSSTLLILVLFELMAITGFLIGAAMGVAFGFALALGLIVAGVSAAVTLGATGFAIAGGDGFLLKMADAREAGPNEQQLRNVVAELSTAAGLPVPKVFVIESMSRNALSVGRDQDHGTIAITRGLLETLNREELQGVVAHELAHIANLDSRHAVLVAILVGAIVLLTDAFLQLVIEIAKHPWTGDDLRDTAAALAMWVVVVVVGLIVGGLLKLVAPIAALAVQAAVSRDREYLADATAIGITRNTAGLIGALEKLEAGTGAGGSLGGNRGTQHLWIVNPVKDPKEGGRGWFATHPATSDRIARLRALTGQDGPMLEAAPPDASPEPILFVDPSVLPPPPPSARGSLGDG